MRRLLATVVCVTVLGSLGCATYLDDLNRAERHYQANEHERALALFRVIEPDLDSLSHADRTRYAYLRGINDYRMSGKGGGTTSSVDQSYRANARHWLALARSLEKERPGGLQESWKSNLDEALRDLSQDVYGVGVYPEEPSTGSTKSEDTASEPVEEKTDSDAPAEESPGL